MPDTFSPEKNKEEELVYLLAKLPKELRDRWSGEADNLNLDEAILLIQKVLAERVVAKEKIFTPLREIENQNLQEEVRCAIKTIEGSFNNPDLLIGNGSVAEVYEIPEAPHLCVKYLVNPDMAREHGNNFREEAQYLDDMYGHEIEGIRSPRLLFYHSSDFGTCFGMEKIDGKSINIITGKPDSIDYLDVIKRQDMNDVLKRMKNFITSMHNDKKIVHRDLTARNIMVDRKGDWYVIDFGRAKRIEIGDDSTNMSEEADAPTAEGAIRALFAKIA
jgi:serine/threonine protein kinase